MQEQLWETLVIRGQFTQRVERTVVLEAHCDDQQCDDYTLSVFSGGPATIVPMNGAHLDVLAEMIQKVRKQ